MSFRRGQFIPLEGGAGSWMLAHDLNRDGRMDLLVGNHVSCDAWVLLGNGDGTFKKPVGFGRGGRGGASAALADLNQDGRPDLAISLTDSGKVVVLLGDGDGTFKELTVETTLRNKGGSIAAGDYNRDNRVDLVFGGPGDNLGLLTGVGGGSFDSRWIVHSGETGTVAFHDVDRDGWLEVLAGTEGGLVIFSPDGAGHFRIPPRPIGKARTWGFALADLNRDGRTDLIAGGFPYADFATSLGDASGFGPFFDYQFQPRIGPRTAADFDGDGTIDLAARASGVAGKQVHMYAGAGDGWGPNAFRRVLVLEVGFGPDGPAADFNNDGRLDLTTGEVVGNDAGLQILINTSG